MIHESIAYQMMEVVFWFGVASVAYAYFGYPLVLILMSVWRKSPGSILPYSRENAPDVSVLIPAFNEEDVIGKKLENALSVEYPGSVQIVVISDGSTDKTSEIVSSYCSDDRIDFIDLPERKGKANALNRGADFACGEILIFTDASIMLRDDALWEIVRPFSDPDVGCVSGEDKIEEGGGEGLYGKYELSLRRYESQLGSIVGASGSFYAQRKELVSDFPEGAAPDFLSVLNTVKHGYRAISTPKAIGYMTAVDDSGGEFRRKVRTVIRGMTALFRNRSLLNPFRFPRFAFYLWSHKIARWCVPICLLGIFVSNLFLLHGTLYLVLMVAQLSFYVVAMAAFIDTKGVGRQPVARTILYFCLSNAAILVAWIRYIRGVRQEVWGPSKRTT